MDVQRFITRIKAAAWSLLGKLRRHESVPHPRWLNLAPPAPIPADPVEHVKDFALRYYELLEAIARKRMREVGVPEDRIGMIDTDFNLRLAAFHPYAMDGGGIHRPTGRINLDAGIFKPDLLAGQMPQAVSSFYERSRASVKADAIIAHEFEEGIRGNHETAEAHAPETSLAIKEQSRRLLRALRDRSL